MQVITSIPALVVAIRPRGRRLELVAEIGDERAVGCRIYRRETVTVPLSVEDSARLRDAGVDTVLGHGCRLDRGALVFPNGERYGAAL